MGGNFGHFLPLFPPHLYITLDGTRQDRRNHVAEGGGLGIGGSPPLPKKKADLLTQFESGKERGAV